eukprot:scaffold175072_cov45-Prasinocladus_malaysianus.AAC.1
MKKLNLKLFTWASPPAHHQDGGWIRQSQKHLVIAYQGTKFNFMCLIDPRDSEFYITVHYQGRMKNLIKLDDVDNDSKPVNPFQKPINLMKKVINMARNCSSAIVVVNCGRGQSAV